MKFRKGSTAHLKKQIREKDPKQTARLTQELINAGRFLSSKAFRLYCVLKWFNPSFPSYTQLRVSTGYAKEALANAIEELELKCMIKRLSGKAHRENNLYTLTARAEWDLLKIPLSPSAKHKAAKRKREMGRLLSALNQVKDKFDYRTSTISIIELVTRPIIEQELDQPVTRSNNYCEDALHHPSTNSPAGGDEGLGKRSPNGQDQRDEKKGVRLSADDLKKPGLAKLKAKWKSQDEQRRRAGW